MQLVIIALLVIALALLVFGLIGSSSALVVSSILVSLVAVVAIARARRHRLDRIAAERAEAERRAKIEADRDATTRVLAAAAAAASRSAAGVAGPESTADQDPIAEPALVGTDPVAPDSSVAELDVDDPEPADSIAPVVGHGDDPVWVIDGRPRYHAWTCEFLHGRPSESVPLSQAVTDGFTPCGQCDPDRALAGSADQSGSAVPD